MKISSALLLFLLLAARLPAASRDRDYPPTLPGARQEIYKRIGDTNLAVHIFEPATPVTNRAAIVCFFGGGWQSGSPKQFESQCRHFAARGMVALAADYRVGSRHGAKAADCVADAKTCVRWVRQNAARLGIDPQRIVAAGGSAGGHIAAATATLPGFDAPGEDASVSAVPGALVLFNPVLVLAPLEGLELSGFGVGVGRARLGAEPRELSPAHHVKAGTPPTLILHGKSDTTVPYPTVEAFTKAMQAAGNRCELIGYEGQAHGFFNFGRGDGRYYRETLAAADTFLVSLGYLEPVAAAAQPASNPAAAATAAIAGARPNLLFILADDLGYGDVRANFPASKIATPNLGRLAAAGMRFTDAHSSSAVCTPTRYNLLTGRYNWRTRLQSGVLDGYSPALIAPDRLTVGKLLQQHGYTTACIGKWHLGMNWQRLPGVATNAEGWKVDYTQAIAAGPVTRGFDAFFGLAASLDMPPYVFIENDHTVGLPTTNKTWVRKGPAAADFEAEAVLPTLTARAVEFIQRQAGAASPFFLYLPLNSPHTPIVPAMEWLGRSGLNEYADFVMQTDAAVGQILAALDRTGAATNTLVIFTSDNGCSPSAKFEELAAKGHQPSGPWRGTKADIFEGGHRVPFFVRWPGRVQAGATSDQIICLGDLMATCAEILGAKLPDDAGEDSVSFLPALLGTDRLPLRDALVQHSINGSFAIRQGRWKLALCPDSGGWSAPKPGTAAANGLPRVQLYDLVEDPGEQQNLQARHPEVVARLTQLLEKYIAEGRSTPGMRLTNDVPVKRWQR
jgi:arylsulfatase A